MTWTHEAARYLAREPESVDRALAVHIEARFGRCAACGPTTSWPCAVAIIAGLARSLLDDARISA